MKNVKLSLLITVLISAMLACGCTNDGYDYPYLNERSAYGNAYGFHESNPASNNSGYDNPLLDENISYDNEYDVDKSDTTSNNSGYDYPHLDENISYDNEYDVYESNSVSIPPAIDSIFSEFEFSGDNLADSGFQGVDYISNVDKEQTLKLIDKYIKELEKYGYKKVDSEVILDCFYVYYLDYTQGNMTDVVYRDNSNSIAMEAMFLDDGAGSLFSIFYSPDIIGNYIDIDVPGPGPSPVPGPRPNPDKSCHYCGGDGYNTCTTCNGRGYYEITVNVPNYAGNGSGGTKTERKNCNSFSCDNGRKKCSYCDGTGQR